MNPQTSTPPDAAATTASTAPTATPTVGDERLQKLFRHTLRSGQVNPLIHLLRAHRATTTP